MRRRRRTICQPNQQIFLVGKKSFMFLAAISNTVPSVYSGDEDVSDSHHLMTSNFPHKVLAHFSLRLLRKVEVG
jgi:hypothetical protein